MQTIVLIAHVLIAAMIVGLVLLQRGKGADAGTGFGAGAAIEVTTVVARAIEQINACLVIAESLVADAMRQELFNGISKCRRRRRISRTQTRKRQPKLLAQVPFRSTCAKPELRSEW